MSLREILRDDLCALSDNLPYQQSETEKAIYTGLDSVDERCRMVGHILLCKARVDFPIFSIET